MMVFHKYKCLKCKENFIVSSGGFINKLPETSCPKCGSSLTIPLPT